MCACFVEGVLRSSYSNAFVGSFACKGLRGRVGGGGGGGVKQGLS